jgi:16S rRNA (adenine1518-N6/adenine1519-N6)-dimethyltransferase
LERGFKFSKSMGQNFLVDKNIPVKIVKGSGIDDSCGVLEVGPGLGALTVELCKSAEHVTVVELDTRLIPMLNDLFTEHNNISIVQGDILKIDIKQLVNDTMPSLSYHVCANLPYNITTPVITALIETDVFESITVMVQREVALRICARPGSQDYGAFTVFANFYTEPEILFDVSPACFNPRPKVTSSVVKMKIRNERILSGEDERIFFRVVRAAFGQRRKTLINALYAVFENTYSKAEISGAVESCGFDKNIRGEVLSIDDFIKLSAFFNDTAL